MRKPVTRISAGFTLVELLVVITIIGILIALLLPAVQAAREAARLAQCQNNLKQVALGCLNHENVIRRFPTGGWGCAWVGDPDRGTNWRQPGGWIYNVLPYIEQQALHDLGMGGAAWNSPAKMAASLQRISTPLPMLYCPTRRRAIAYPFTGAEMAKFYNTDTPSVVGRSDYAANSGDYWTEVVTGIVYCGSLTKMADVTDGASNTYLAGEKYLNPDAYLTGSDGSDNETCYTGDNQDIERWSSFHYPIVNPVTDWCLPYQDRPGVQYGYSFGSAHASGFNMAFCDGSVHVMNYSIAPETHRRFANRKDGQTIDAKSF
jgi:prepilin-type N-terminal cleavage/methylation domain-containing protein/prepilin-type processing-associated H-X9-DG protein